MRPSISWCTFCFLTHRSLCSHNWCFGDQSRFLAFLSTPLLSIYFLSFHCAGKKQQVGLVKYLCRNSVCVCVCVCIVREKQVGGHDISRLSGVERLSPEERELCTTCRLHPEALLGYMTQLESEGQRCGQLRLADARRLLKIDVNKTRKIFNHLVSRGRISCQ